MSNYETMDIFAKNLNDLLARRGINQLTLAKAMDVSASTVCFWCSGEKMPRMNRIERMAEYFGVPKSALLERPSANADVLQEVDVAFYGSFRQLSEDDRQTIRDMVEVMRRRRGLRSEAPE